MKGCDIVFHLVSLLLFHIVTLHSQYVETNINGTLNILNIAKEYDIDVVHTSTSETYGSAQFVPINESHPLVAQTLCHQK